MQAACFAFLGLVLAGCATAPKVDWNSRIGTYSFDQAVLEMGPPDKVATLGDGAKVAEWLTSRGSSQGPVTTFGPHFYHPYFYGPPVVYNNEAPYPDPFMRLVFAPDGKLSAWRKVYR